MCLLSFVFFPRCFKLSSRNYVISQYCSSNSELELGPTEGEVQGPFAAKNTYRSRLNAGGVYLKPGLVDAAFIALARFVTRLETRLF